MSDLINCQHCGTQNPIASSNCSRCGANLADNSNVECASCGTSNPASRLYCAQCGDPLSKPNEESISQSPESGDGVMGGFSLPTRKPGDTGELDVNNIPEWLRTGVHETIDSNEQPAADTPAASPLSTDEWQINSNDDQELEDLWNSSFAATPDSEPAFQPPDELDFSWLAEDPIPAESTPAVDDPVQWVPDESITSDSEQSTGTDESANSDPFGADSSELPAWLVEAQASTPDAPPFYEEPAGSDASVEIPDWLRDVSGEIAVASDEQAQADAEQPTPTEDVLGLDNLSNLLDNWDAAQVDEVKARDDASDSDDSMVEGDNSLVEADIAALLDDTPSEPSRPVEPVDLTGFTTWLEELSSDELPPDARAGRATALEGAEAEVKPVEEALVDDIETTPFTAEASEADPIVDSIESALPPADLPDWLADVSAAVSNSDDPPLADAWTEDPVSQGDIPNWLQEIAPDTGILQDAPELPAAQDEAATAAPDEFDSFEDLGFDSDGDLLSDSDLDFINEDELAPSIEAQPDIEVEEPTPFKEDDPAADIALATIPDWLSHVDPTSQSEEPALFDDEFIQDISGGDISYEEMPDWLNSPVDDDFDSALEAAIAVQGEEMVPTMGNEWTDVLNNLPAAEDENKHILAEAEIPDWIRDMEPDPEGDAKTPEPEETTGPLSGMRGVIDIEPIIARPRESLQQERLSTTQEQAKQVQLLRQLATAEPAQGEQIREAAVPGFPKWLRWLVSALLLSAIFTGLFFAESPLFETEAPVEPAGINEALNALSLPINQTVLFIFDYTPATAAELDPQAELALTILQQNGNQIMTVSQSATGTALAQQQTNLFESLPLTSLGFLPGEAAGLRQFGSCMPSLVDCETLFGVALPPAPSDIALVILLTSEQDNLINWIEQVGTQHPELTFVAGITSALLPVATPYLESSQLDGIIGGINGAVLVEQAVGNGNSAQTVQQAQTLAQYLIIALVLLGNIGFFIAGSLRPKTAKRRRRKSASKRAAAKSKTAKQTAAKQAAEAGDKA